MEIQLIADCAMGENFSFGMYTKENREFLQKCGTGTKFKNVIDHNMNYYKLQNGYIVHKYNAFEISNTETV